MVDVERAWGGSGVAVLGVSWSRDAGLGWWSVGVVVGEGRGSFGLFLFGEGSHDERVMVRCC